MTQAGPSVRLATPKHSRYRETLMSCLVARVQRVAACGLVALLLASPSGWLHVADVSDGVAVFHDASAHRIEGAAGRHAPVDQHCYLCHWERILLRLAPGRSVRATIDAATPQAALDASARLHAGADDLQIPARAPPA